MSSLPATNRTRVVCLLAGALCLAAQSACSGQEGDDAERSAAPTVGSLDRSAISEDLRGADLVRDLSIVTFGTGAEHRIRFHSLGRDFSLQLTPNRELFSRDLVVVRDGIRLTPEQAGLAPPLRGAVEGDSRSWARMLVRNGSIEGLLFTANELYEIRPKAQNRSELAMAQVALSDYLESPTGNQEQCGVIDNGPVSAEPATPDELQQAGCVWIGIHVIADYTHAAKLGGASGSEAEMAMRMNEIDGLYRADLNYGFRIEMVTSHATQGGPGYNAPGINMNAQLEALATWKSQNDAARGVVHLFAGRVTSGAVGLAYVGGLCGSRTASGVSNYLGANRGSTICPAHEIGHNFGANHDASGAVYVMAPAVNRNATAFSAASKTAITNHVRTRTCFSPCGGSGTGGVGGAGGGSGTGGRGGSAGSAGMGGAGGNGGAAGGSGSGGSAGRGGSAGSGATGGLAGTAGSGGLAGGNQGGSSGASGTSGVGGSAGAAPGTGGTAGSGTAGRGAGGVAGGAGSGAGSPGAKPAETAPLEVDGGCGCRTVPASSSGAFGLLIGLGLFGALKRRRRVRHEF